MRAVSVRMPETIRGRSSGSSESAALEQLGVGRRGGNGHAQLMRGVGNKWHSCCSFWRSRDSDATRAENAA